METAQLREYQTSIFRGGSKTYFNSSLFFPPAVRTDVVRFYAFVRVADDYVDQVPPDREGFQKFRQSWDQVRSGSPGTDVIVNDFYLLAQERNFDHAWVEAFLDVMASDMDPVPCHTLEDTLRYTYGSAEVIGLFMSAILGLDQKSTKAALMQGRAMQMINFIRDLAEDEALGRSYLPLSETSLGSLGREEAYANKEEFCRFVRAQLQHYEAWQKEAYGGYQFLPRRYRVPIQTATDMYNWTARTIEKDPLLVFERKVKPPKWQVIAGALWNFLFLPARGK